MKKNLLLLFAVLCSVQSMFALTIESGQYYTIRNFPGSSLLRSCASVSVP